MQYIEDKNEIKTHMLLVDSFINKDKKKEFVYQNIFNEKFKYLLFVEEGDFSQIVQDGFKKYLNEINEVDFHINILSEKECIIPYSFDYKNEIAYQNLKVELDESAYEFFSEELYKVYWEYLCYSKTLNWCGWFDKSADVGIFAFQTRTLAKRFLEKFERHLFYTPEELVNESWNNWRTPNQTYKESFLKHYTSLSYL